jgi:dihydrofolate reductase
MPGPKLFIYIAMSLDGFIATKNDDLSWLDMVDREGEDYGYASFSATVEHYIVGRKTYDKVRQMVGNFPPANQFKCYVLSRTKSGVEDGVTFFNGDVSDLVSDLRTRSDKNIYCDGGGEVIKLLMERDLIDEYIISIIPIVLGDGKRLFIGGTPRQAIELNSTRRYESGLVQLSYSRKR